MVVKNIGVFIIGLVIGMFIISSIKLYEIRLDNQKLQEDITEINHKIDIIKEDNIANEDQLNELMKEKKDKWEELEIWNKAKEKLQKVLS